MDWEMACFRESGQLNLTGVTLNAKGQRDDTMAGGILR